MNHSARDQDLLNQEQEMLNAAIQASLTNSRSGYSYSDQQAGMMDNEAGQIIDRYETANERLRRLEAELAHALREFQEAEADYKVLMAGMNGDDQYNEYDQYNEPDGLESYQSGHDLIQEQNREYQEMLRQDQGYDDQVNGYDQGYDDQVNGYDDQGYDDQVNGYDQGYDDQVNGYDDQGYDDQGYDDQVNGYDDQGYDDQVNGYDDQGYDDHQDMVTDLMPPQGQASQVDVKFILPDGQASQVSTDQAETVGNLAEYARYLNQGNPVTISAIGSNISRCLSEEGPDTPIGYCGIRGRVLVRIFDE